MEVAPGEEGEGRDTFLIHVDWGKVSIQNHRAQLWATIIPWLSHPCFRGPVSSWHKGVSLPGPETSYHCWHGRRDQGSEVWGYRPVRECSQL